MKFFVKPLPAPIERSEYSRQIALALAGVITVMVVMQLFTFEEFVELADMFLLPGLSGMLFAASVIVFGVLSLPFLLRMALSPAFRWVSMVSLIGFMTLWLYSTVTVVLFRAVESVGFSGGLGTLTPGWWAIFVVFAMSSMVAWSLWGLWPARQGRT